MKKLSVIVIVFCVLSVCIHAELLFDDFSGDLSEWTTGPPHLDSYGIVGGELSIDRYGYLPNGSNGGWGVPQFNQKLDSDLMAALDDRIMYFDRPNFALSANFPWEFTNRLGYTEDDYWHSENSFGFCMIDFAVPGGLLLGVLCLSVAGRKLRRCRPA